MAVIESPTSGAVCEVDPAHKSQRATLRPVEALGVYSFGAASGALTGVAAGGALFSLRNLSANLLLVRRIGIGLVVTTAFTTAQQLQFGLAVARSFTASDTGGTAIALTGSNAKVRTSLATPTSVDARIGTTAALTAGTKTLDANRLGFQAMWAGVIGATMAPNFENLYLQTAVGYPLVLATNEGLNIINEVAMGAAGVLSLVVNIEFAEAAAY
jgi:hypothetical protein